MCFGWDEFLGEGMPGVFVSMSGQTRLLGVYFPGGWVREFLISMIDGVSVCVCVKKIV